MTRHQLISKAQKITTLMMRSPFKGERITAATLLHKFLNEHGLTTSDVGLGYINLGHLVNNTNNESFDNSDIVEVHYKQAYHTICDGWVESLIVKVCSAYGARCGVRDDKVRIVGFRDDVNAVKTTIVKLRRYVEVRISIHGFSQKQQVLCFATSLIYRVTKDIKSSHLVSIPKLAKLSDYMFRYYGLLPFETTCDGYVKYDFRTFVAAQYDARDFRKAA